MNLNGLNAVAAVAILNKKHIPRPLKLQGVVLASFIPGPWGLAVPLAIANRSQNKIPELQANVLEAPMRASVPDLAGLESFEKAVESLARVGLVGRKEAVLSVDVDPDRVVSQSHRPNADVPQGTEIFVRISQGPLPPVAPPADIEKDLDEKIDNAKEELEEKMKDHVTEIKDAITAAVAELRGG